MEPLIKDSDHSQRELQVSCQSQCFVKKELTYTQKTLFRSISPTKASAFIKFMQKELFTIKGQFSIKSSITGPISLTHIKINRFSTFR